MKFENGAHWIVVGSSPSAPGSYRAARENAPRDGAYICTCNGGLIIDPMPDVYWISDSVAVKQFWRMVTTAKALGTHVITHRQAVACTPQLAELAPEIVEADLGHYSGGGGPVFVPGARKYINARTSGCYLVQYAVNHGAASIALVGMEGYTSRPGHVAVDYFDGRVGKTDHAQVMLRYAAAMQEIVSASPGVRFEVYGELTYALVGANVVRMDGREKAQEEEEFTAESQRAQRG